MPSLRQLCGLLREFCTRSACCSSCGVESDGAEERIEVSDDPLIQPIEAMEFLFGQTRVRADGIEQTSSERRVDAFEEFQEEDAEAISLGHESVAPRVRDLFDEAFRAKRRQIVAEGAETVLVQGRIERGSSRGVQVAGREGVGARDVCEANEGVPTGRPRLARGARL